MSSPSQWNLFGARLHRYPSKPGRQAVATAPKTKMVKRPLIEGITKAERQRRRQQLGDLHSLIVRPSTVDRYKNAFRRFVSFLAGQNQQIAPTKTQLDLQVEEYIEFLWQDGEGVSLAGDTLSSLQYFQPSLKRCLPGGWRLLRTWQRHELPSRAPPFTRETLAVFLGFVHSVSPDIAVALYLGFVCLLRTGEILSLQSRDILIPSDGSTVILFLGETKTAPRNPHAGTVVAHDLVLTHLLQKWKRVNQEDAFLVPWNQTKFRTFFRDALEKCGLSKWDYKPYSLRRGGATDLWLTCRSFSQVTHTGRWTSERTAKIYIQDSVSLLTTLTFVATPKQKTLMSLWQEVSRVEPRHMSKKRGRGRK